MTAPVTLTIHFDVGRTSANATRRLNRWEVSRRAKVSKLAALQALADAGFPEHDGPVRLDYLARRAHAVDDDGIVSGAKWMRDTLCNRAKNGVGIVPDDSPKWVTLGTVTQEIDKQWKGREQLVLTVTPREKKP